MARDTCSAVWPALSPSSSSRDKRSSSSDARPSTSLANFSAQNVRLEGITAERLGRVYRCLGTRGIKRDRPYTDHDRADRDVFAISRTPFYVKLPSLTSYSEVPGFPAQADPVQCHPWRYAIPLSPVDLFWSRWVDPAILVYAEKAHMLCYQVPGITARRPRCSGAPSAV